MNAMPLPLQLTRPVPMYGDLDALFRSTLTVGGYNPNTQYAGGGHGGKNTCSSTEAEGILNLDVADDVQIDVDL